MCTEITTGHGRWVCCAVTLTCAETEAKEAGHITGFPRGTNFSVLLLRLKRINSKYTEVNFCMLFYVNVTLGHLH
jgi:hypothetical protein